MGFILSSMIASAVGALFVVRFAEYAISGVVDGISGTAKGGLKLGLFVGTWTAITTASGMSAFTERVRKLRQLNRAVSRRIDAPPQDRR